ncbi:hypothetical protein [Aquamicrobium lusatiense]|uniref:hypothetical protein n=1 Tax=Aquamicrobium lusatiense TaxID=89772 RepID=UPI001AEDA9B8|nr:hypothetical protein [Aquamicrobium lusatiense]
MTNHSTSAPDEASAAEEPRTFLDALDLLDKAIFLNQLVFMAGHSLNGHVQKSAIATGCDVINDILRDARSVFKELRDDQVRRASV